MLGPTVEGQIAYDWPEDFLLPLSLSLGAGEPLDPADPDTVRRYETGSLALVRDNVYVEDVGEDGVRRAFIYPAPGAGLALNLLYVFAPPPMTEDSDEPSELPRPFHEALIPAAAAQYFETVEDNPELGQRNAEQLDLWVGKIVRYDNQRRGGSGPFAVPIQGVSA